MLAVIAFTVVYNIGIDVFVSKTYIGSSLVGWLTNLQRPYLYVVGHWSAFSKLVTSPLEQPHWALITLRPLWKILGKLLGIIDPVPETLPFIDIGLKGPVSIKVIPLSDALY